MQIGASGVECIPSQNLEGHAMGGLFVGITGLFRSGWSTGSEWKRLAWAGTVAAAIGMASISAPGDARANEIAAKKTVTAALEDLRKLYQSAESRDQIADGIEDVLEKYANMELISQSVIGVPWRRATKEQRDEFTDVFTRYLAEKYARHFPEALGGDFAILGALEMKKNQFAVESEITMTGSSPYNLKWLVHRQRGKTRIVNVVTHDFNLLTLERTVIRSLLQQRKGNLDQLIEYLPTRYL